MTDQDTKADKEVARCFSHAAVALRQAKMKGLDPHMTCHAMMATALAEQWELSAGQANNLARYLAAYAMEICRSDLIAKLKLEGGSEEELTFLRQKAFENQLAHPVPVLRNYAELAAKRAMANGAAPTAPNDWAPPGVDVEALTKEPPPP